MDFQGGLDSVSVTDGTGLLVVLLVSGPRPPGPLSQHGLCPSRGDYRTSIQRRAARMRREVMLTPWEGHTQEVGCGEEGGEGRVVVRVIGWV